MWLKIHGGGGGGGGGGGDPGSRIWDLVTSRVSVFYTLSKVVCFTSRCFLRNKLIFILN